MSTPFRLPKKTDSERLVVAFLKPDGHRYVFLADTDPQSIIAAIRTAGLYASDPDLSFTWQDACFVAWKLKQLAAEA